MFFERWFGKREVTKLENKGPLFPSSGETGQGAGRRDESIFRGESVAEGGTVSSDREPADVQYEYVGSDVTLGQVASVGENRGRGSEEDTTGEQQIILERIRGTQEAHPESFDAPGQAAGKDDRKAA